MNSGVGQVHQIDVWDSVKAVLLDPAGCCSGICTFLLLRCLWSQHVIASYSCYCYWYQRKICLEHLVDLIDVDHGWCHVLHGAALLRWQCFPHQRTESVHCLRADEDFVHEQGRACLALRAFTWTRRGNMQNAGKDSQKCSLGEGTDCLNLVSRVGWNETPPAFYHGWRQTEESGTWRWGCTGYIHCLAKLPKEATQRGKEANREMAGNSFHHIPGLSKCLGHMWKVNTTRNTLRGKTQGTFLLR